MHLFAATSEPSNSRVFKSLAAHPEARTKFVGYKTFYLFLGVITQSQPGHPMLIIAPEAARLRDDFRDRERAGGVTHTTRRTPRCPAAEEELGGTGRLSAACPLLLLLPAASSTFKGCARRGGRRVCAAPALQAGCLVAVVPALSNPFWSAQI